MIEARIFEKIDFTESNFACDQYEDCRFLSCNFYGISLSNNIFRECVFEQCDLSLVTWTNVTLNDVRFVNCKMVGVQLDVCNPFLFSVSFQKCILRLAVFYKLNLKKTIFDECELQEADFTESNLMESSFVQCDLKHATFIQTNLEKADLRTAVNYSIDPVNNKIKKARFSVTGAFGLLDRFNILIE